MAAEDRAAGALAVIGLVGSVGAPALGIILVDDLADEVEVFLGVGDEYRAVEHVVAEALADFAFAASGNGAGFVAEGAFTVGADDAPTGRARVFFEADLEAGGSHVDFAGFEGN